MQRGKPRTLDSTVMDSLPPDVVDRAERQVNAVFAKIIGGVMLWVGVTFIGLLLWVLHAIVVLGRPLNLFVSGIASALAIVGVFCLLVGWRLFLNRPNRFGSILGPVGWRILGGMFGVFFIACFILAIVLLRGDSSEILVTAVTSTAGSAIFCYWCFYSAKRAAANAARPRGAL